MDVLDTILLSLHPKSKLANVTVSDYTREGLAEMQQFQDLIHMDIHKGYDGYGRRSDFLNGLNSISVFPCNWISQVRGGLRRPPQEHA